MTLLDDLRAEGVTVVEENGWERRARPGAFHPVGVMVHHTAGHGDLAVVRNGRHDLAGPLANIWPAKDGTAHLIGAGRCNHAGKGSRVVLADVQADRAPADTAARRGLHDDTDGNAWFYAIEVENLGDGRDPYPVSQLAAVVGCCAAFCRAHGWSTARVIGHKEWTRRKIDPSLGMAELRTLVAGRLTTTNPQEDDVTQADIDAIADRVLAKLTPILNTGNDGAGKPRGAIGAVVAKIDQRTGEIKTKVQA